MSSQQLPTNAELASQFFSVMMSTSKNRFTIMEQKRLIENCPRSIAEAFAVRGNLEGFKIPRLHAKYYAVLEAILRKGTSVASEALMKKDVAEQRRKAFKGIPGSSGANLRAEEPLPTWEDAVKRMES